MFTSDTTSDQYVWSNTNVVRYPEMANFDETRSQARKQVQAVPFAAKWKSVLAVLEFLTPGQVWLNRAVVKTFGGFLSPKTQPNPP